jgi:peptidyl-prolyl cis-trans isomerase-like protein 2
VAVRTSGNVYCREAVEELNLKAKHMRDLLTDEAFVRKDVVTIQDPKDLRGKNVGEYDHLRRRPGAGRGDTEGGGTEGGGTEGGVATLGSHVRVVGGDTGRVLEAVRKHGSMGMPESQSSFPSSQSSQSSRKILYTSEPVRKRYETVSFKPGTATWNTDDNQASPDATMKKKLGGKSLPQPYSTELRDTNVTMGGASKSLTSTAVNLSLTNERAQERVYLRPKAGTKGYVRLHTTLGDLNLELHCDLAPKTCENFLALAASGYYDGVPFHRSIRNFMIQGGDPTGTGTGGANVFGTLEDELHPGLKHDGRGVVSMANSGKDTNGSQFFITYKSAKHLDGKHSILGRVVGGFDVLTKMEQVPCDAMDRPREEIRITRCTVFVNPYTDMLEEAANAREREAREAREARKTRGGEHADQEGGGAVQRLDDIMRVAGGGGGGGGGGGDGDGGGVGKYLDVHGIASSSRAPAAPASQQQPAKKKAKPLSNFDAW